MLQRSERLALSHVHRVPSDRRTRGVAALPPVRLALVVLALLPALAAAQQVTVPKWNGRITALGDRDNDGDTDANDYTFSASSEQARDTHDLCKLDAAVGFDKVLEDLGPAFTSRFAAIGVVEANFALMDPPADLDATDGTRRILRGSGGLRLYLVHKGTPEGETFSFAHWGSETRTFLPKEGCMQTADNLATQTANHPEFAALANLFVTPKPMSVRKVRAFKGANDRPMLVVACSTLHPSANFDANDQMHALEARENRLFEWQTSGANANKFVDVTAVRWPTSAYANQRNTCGLAVGDLNQDGRVDVVLGQYLDGFAGSKNKILLQKTNGTFEEILPSFDPFNGIVDPTADVEIADIDGNGFQDIVVVNRYALTAPGVHAPDPASRNYVLWQRLMGFAPGHPTQPGFLPTQYLLGPTGAAAMDDSVAVDVADCDSPPDGRLEIVIGNHGLPGTVFVPDNADPSATCSAIPSSKNADLFYHQESFRTFHCYELKGSGGADQMTTDIVFEDVVKPNRVQPPVTGDKWDFRTDAAFLGQNERWTAGAILDGLPDIVRVARRRSGESITHYLNDPHDSFDKYYDATGQLTDQYSGGTIPPLSGDYDWNFLKLSGDPGTKGPWALSATTTPPAPLGMPDDLKDYQGIMDAEFLQFPQVLLYGDFAPDGPPSLPAYDDWPSPMGFPDCFVGMGYELGGVNNRLFPFHSTDFVLRISGSEYPGIYPLHRGNASWTAGWTEMSSHGYGAGLIDMDNDGDLDLLNSKRTAMYLYENRGAPSSGGLLEGLFQRVTSTALWPFVELPYAHTQFFREDSVTADFDEDGDQDALVVGYGGELSGNIIRGELNDEDVNQDGWLRDTSDTYNDRMFHSSALVENRTAQGATPGTFALRSDRLDFNGRHELARGGERAVVADFDADGKLDVFETCWTVDGHSTSPSGFHLPVGDPTLAPVDLWNVAGGPDYDGIAPHKYVAYRLWHNVVPSGPPYPVDPRWFVDETAARVRCKDANNVEHYGPLDAKGGMNYQTGTTSALLHRRIGHALGAADFNCDGYVDVITAYTSVEGLDGYNLFLNDGTGKLLDATSMLPPYTSLDVAGTGTSTANSTGLALFDSDNDGDVDIFLSFFGAHRTAMIENKHPATAPAFVARPFDYPAAGGWVEGAIADLNGNPGGNDYMTWTVPVDLDLDDDLDLVLMGGTIAHRFYRNRLIDPVATGARFVDQSLDETQDCNAFYDDARRTELIESGRITMHHGATAVDVEVGDLNGDGHPDLFAEYNHRPANTYYSDGAGVTLGLNRAVVSNVFPASGCKKGEKFRIYGMRLTNVTRVHLITKNGSQSITGANLGAYPHGRYLDVTIPTSLTVLGPARIKVTRTIGTTQHHSPIWGGSPFTVTP